MLAKRIPAINRVNLNGNFVATPSHNKNKINNTAARAPAMALVISIKLNAARATEFSTASNNAT